MSDTIPRELTDECAKEPIHIPGSIMPFGMLLAVSAGDDHRLLRASANAGPLLLRPLPQALGAPFDGVAAPGIAAIAEHFPRVRPGSPIELPRLRLADALYHVLCHRSGDEIVIELEEPSTGESDDGDRLYGEVRGLAEALHELADIPPMGQAAAQTVRRITGFDRVLVYRFDANWDGTVIAEERNDELPSYLGLRFPAFDIPPQARDLYRVNRFRQIPDVDYAPVALLSAADVDRPLDLSFSVLRSVSPVHLHYMRNMGTGASMSLSIVVDGELWGLVACHNVRPRRIPPAVRAACNFVGQVVSMSIAGHVRYADAAERVRRQRIQASLLAAMAARPRFMEGLLLAGDDLVSLANADGVAVVADGGCIRVGSTPEEPLIRRIATWLAERGETDLFATTSLPAVMPDLDAAAPLASGLLAISISQIHASYVLWFRAEAVRSVEWAGDPRKSGTASAEEPPRKLSPRSSFETWKEQVHLKSHAWTEADHEAARDLRSAIVNIVLRRAEQMADISRELERSNKELEAFSYSISHDLRAPFRHIVGYAELLRERDFGRMDEKSRHYVDTIIDSAFSAGKLVDDLLKFSQMGRMTIQRIPVSTSKLVEEVVRSSQPDMEGRNVEFRIGELPPVQGDPNLLRQVFQNLVSNAIKYTRGRDPALIEIQARSTPEEDVFTVRDNGVGFDMAYVGKLFGVFQRLHRIEEFEGTGIGLANVRRIVERHGGRVEAEGRLGEGATFTFALPAKEIPST
jgi:two-component system, chemotaxis family, sensor kinase Cph1